MEKCGTYHSEENVRYCREVLLEKLEKANKEIKELKIKYPL